MRKLILFGASKMGKIVEEYLNIEIEYYVDNDPAKWGKSINNKIIKSSQALLKEKKAEIVIGVTSVYYNEIKIQLEEMGFVENDNFLDISDIYYFKEKGNEEKIKQIEYLIIEFIKGSFSAALDTQNKYVLTTRRLHTAGMSSLELLYKTRHMGLSFLYIENYLRQSVAIEQKIDIDSYRTVNYRGINLYNVCIFDICYELDIIGTEFDILRDDHCKVLNYYYVFAVDCINRVYNLINSKNIVKSIIFNGYDMKSSIIRKICIINDIPTYTLEVTLNKNKLVWDNISCIPTNKNLAKNYYWRYKDLLGNKDYNSYREEFFKNIASKKQSEHISPKQQLSICKKKRTILFIAQVYIDTSIIFGIKDFKTPIHIIEQLVKYSLDQDTNLVIKIHPSETYSEHLKDKELTYKKLLKSRCIETISKHNSIIVDYNNKYDTYNLIDQADVCVTINSQAGFEALLKGKEVILCGESFYGGLGFTYDAIDKEDLIYYLERVLGNNSKRNNIDEVSKLFYIFNEMYCIEKNESSLLELINQ